MDEMIHNNIITIHLPGTVVTIAMITYIGVDGIQTLMYYYFHNALFCEINTIPKTLHNPSLPITINLTFSITELYNGNGYGTGYMIELFYGLQIPAFLL
jgi:hypothetical protein